MDNGSLDRGSTAAEAPRTAEAAAAAEAEATVVAAEAGVAAEAAATVAAEAAAAAAAGGKSELRVETSSYLVGGRRQLLQLSTDVSWQLAKDADGPDGKMKNTRKF